MMIKNNQYKAELALLSNTLIWGATFVLIKTALNDSSPMAFVAVRFAISTLVLFILFRKYLKNISRKSLIQGFWLGVVLYLGFIFQTIGLSTTTATKSAFITGTFVVFTPIFQIITEKRAPTKKNVISIVLVFIGISLLSSKGDSVFDVFIELGANFTFGDFLTLLCAILFAWYIVYLDIISKDNDFRYLTFAQVSVTFVFATFSTLLFNALGIEPLQFDFSGNLIFALLYTSLLATVLNLLLQTKFQPMVTPTKAGLIFSLEPIFASTFAFIFLHETQSSFGILGALFIFAGVIISEIKNNR